MGDGDAHRGHTFGGGEDGHHRIFFPEVAGVFVADTAPKINDGFAAIVDGAGGAELAALSEVALELLADGFESGRDHSLYPRLLSDSHLPALPISRTRASRRACLAMVGRCC